MKKHEKNMKKHEKNMKKHKKHQKNMIKMENILSRVFCFSKVTFEESPFFS